MQKKAFLNYLPSVIAFLAVGLLAMIFDMQSHGLSRQDARAEVSDKADILRTTLQSHIDGGVYLSRGLASHLSRNQDITQEEFSHIVPEIFTDMTEILNVAWAPDLIVARIHPIEGNEKAIGLDYRTQPDQLDSVVQARDTGQATLVGPVDLVQGGKGFIFRIPVYARGGETVLFKGVLSLVFDMEAFLAKSGISDPAAGIEVAMAIDHGRFTPQEMIVGLAELALDDPVTAQILVPGGRWTIFARPQQGWKAAYSDLLYDRLLLLFVCGLILFPTVTANILAVARQKTIQDMEAAESRLKGVVENVPGAYLSFVMDENGEHLEFISASCKDIWGIDAESALSDTQKLWDSILREDQPKLQNEIKRARQTMTPWHLQWRIRTPEGNPKWLEGRGNLTALPNGTVRRDSFVVDISEQKKRDEEFEQQAEIMRQAQKQESIGQMTGGVAHDFNNLLAVIRGSLELLRDDIADEANPGDDRMKIISNAIHATDRGADLTKSMLSFARQARLNPEVVDLNEVVRETEAWAGRTLPATIDVQVDLTTPLPNIWVDRGSTASALLNLIMNARDAMPKGGKLTIRTAQEVLDEGDMRRIGDDYDPGTYVVLSITDSGEGITKDNQQRIFEPFFSTKLPGKGSGLGLSMVHGFVKQSGGTVRVTSEPGQGTTFKLYFKALDGTEPDHAAAERLHDEPCSSLRILIAEDDSGVRAILEATLNRLGHTVVTARDGNEALEAFRSDREIDLLITDIDMPGDLLGTDLAREIRHVDKDLPVIFLSGYARDATGIAEDVSPSDIRLMKPVRRKVLADAIARAMALRNNRHSV
ncbi:MAG: ATP-binding protein [Thalassovita sp.]|nr:ATP-binding protein [Thalassovita sp.]